MLNTVPGNNPNPDSPVNGDGVLAILPHGIRREPAQRSAGDLLGASSKLRKNGVKLAEPIVSPWRIKGDVARCLSAGLQHRLETYCKQLAHCQSEFSEEAVHQLRVATRRLLAQFTLVGRVTATEASQKAQAKLKGRLKPLGELRDLHVQRLFVEEQMPRFPALALVHDFLQEREKNLSKALARKVRGFGTRKIENCTSEVCKQLAGSCQGSRGRGVVATNVLRSLSGAFETVATRRQAIEARNSESIHRTRVAFKRFRYMVESLAPVLTGMGKRQLRQLAIYQRRMGNLQDLEIAEFCLADFVRGNPEAEPLLKPFRRYLGRRRARVLSSCLGHADDLFTWNPSWNGQVTLTAA